MSNKQNLIICIIIVAIIAFYILSVKSVENFNPYLNYNRVYPGLYSYYDTELRDKSYYMFPNGQINLNARNSRYNPGYSDYAYIPKHEYLKHAMNSPDRINPRSISEYCVSEKLNEGVDFDYAVKSCITPPSISTS